ncbi:MAG: cell division protein SepF [Bacillota bacterium]
MGRKIMDVFLGLLGFESEEQEAPTGNTDLDNWSEPVTSRNKKPNVVSLHTQQTVKMVVVRPVSYDQVQSIADHLKSRRPVIINMEEIDKDLARRVLDFISGTIYALNGSMQKVSNGVFLFLPSNVTVTGELSMDRERGSLSWGNSNL